MEIGHSNSEAGLSQIEIEATGAKQESAPPAIDSPNQSETEAKKPTETHTSLLNGQVSHTEGEDVSAEQPKRLAGLQPMECS